MKEVANLGNHLGVPIDIGRKKKDHFQFLVDKISSKILACSAVRLSQASKLILIQVVLISISSHVMRCLKIPLSVTNKLDSIITRFFWANKGDHGIHWVDRKTVQFNKGDGGLGIRAMSALNDALLFKQVNHMHINPQLLVSKALTAMRGCQICKNGTEGNNLKGASWGRRGLWEAGSKLFKGMVWKVGNGSKILASSMAWVEGRVPEVKENQHIRAAVKWKVKDFICHATKKWRGLNGRMQIVF